MKTNLDIDLDELPAIGEETDFRADERVQSAVPSRRHLNDIIHRSGSHTAIGKFPHGGALSEAHLAELGRQRTGLETPSSQGGRPMSAATHTTAMASHMSTLPVLDESQIMDVARTLFRNRSTIVEASRRTGARFNLRDTISSTQIYQICKRNGIMI